MAEVETLPDSVIPKFSIALLAGQGIERVCEVDTGVVHMWAPSGAHGPAPMSKLMGTT